MIILVTTANIVTGRQRWHLLNSAARLDPFTFSGAVPLQQMDYTCRLR